MQVSAATSDIMCVIRMSSNKVALHQKFPEMKLRGLVSNFCIHVSVNDLCIPMICPPI